MRARDYLWDEMVAQCGADSETMTKSERGKFNKALKELREVNATPEELKAKARVFKQRWPGISVTPMALVMHWSSLTPPKSRYLPYTPEVVTPSEPEPEMSPQERKENRQRLAELMKDVLSGTEG